MKTGTLGLVLLLRSSENGSIIINAYFGMEALCLLSPLGSGYIYSGLMVFIHAALLQTQQHRLHGHKTDINTPHPTPTLNRA